MLRDTSAFLCAAPASRQAGLRLLLVATRAAFSLYCRAFTPIVPALLAEPSNFDSAGAA